MVNQYYFNSLLGVLHTEENRTRFIVNSVRKGITDEPEHIKTAFEHYEKRNNIHALGVLYERIGNDAYALNLYKEELQKMENNMDIVETERHKLKGARRAEEIEREVDKQDIATLSGVIALINKKWADKKEAWGQKEEAKRDKEEAEKFYTKALVTYEAIGKFKIAAGLAEEMGDTEKAENYKSLDSLLNPKCF